MLAHATGVTTSVVAAAAERRPGALVLDQPFFRLAMNGATGEVFLMQDDDSEDDYEHEPDADHDPAT